jgi:hypothetical protein
MTQREFWVLADNGKSNMFAERQTATDRLAKMALQLVEEHQWVASAPLCIQDIVMFDRQIFE